MNKNNSFKYFILIVVIPMIGIMSIFYLSYFYIKDETNIIKHELEGLDRINKIQNIIFDMQKLRGLSNIAIKNKNCLLDIRDTKQNLINNLNQLKKELNSDNKSLNVKNRLLKHIETIDSHLDHEIIFDHLTFLIQDSIILLEHVAHHSKLILDEEIQSYVLMTTVVISLPELIEYNGQIRGISSSVRGKLLEIDRYKIVTQLSKIKEKLNKLKFNMSQLHDSYTTNKVYKDMLQAQNLLIKFIKDEILDKDIIMINPNEIFRLNSNNIEFITLLYKSNSEKLKQILLSRIDNKQNIAIFIILLTVASMMFVSFINIVFYKKNKRFIEQVELLSITDGMTNLYNRRYFDSEFDKQQKIKKRLKQNLIFIMMDIDHFKQYNDTYGHQSGDDTLISVASSLKKYLKRPDDMVFRLGGEEFGILCSDLCTEQALSFTNKLRKNIENLEIEHKNNSASKFVTISMGLIIIKPNLQSNISNIYKCADEALYNAKQNGRNKVCIYDWKDV